LDFSEMTPIQEQTYALIRAGEGLVALAARLRQRLNDICVVRISVFCYNFPDV
jgi:hypothetical protein